MKIYESHPMVKKAIDPLCKEIPRDCIGIHGKLYEPSKFQKIHPGGSTWIEVCKGTDATTLFETMHLNNKLATSYLNSMDCVGTYLIVQKWNYESYRAVCNKVLQLFPYCHSRATRRFRFLGWCVLGVLLHILVLFQQELDLKWSCVVVSSSMVNTVLGGFGHNYLHKLDMSSLALDWNGLSSFEWIFEHIISHHCTPNSDYDHDTISMLPFVDWQQATPQNILIFPLFAIGEIIVALQGYLGHRCRWRPLFSGFQEIESHEYPLWMRLAPFLFLLRVLSHFVFQPPMIAFFTLLFSLSMASFYFSYLAHLNHAFQGAQTWNFLDHQLNTTGDLQSNEWMPNDLLLGLDKQTLHHLFPTIDHSLLTRELRTTLEETTNKRAFMQKTFSEMNEVMWKRLVGSNKFSTKHKQRMKE